MVLKPRAKFFNQSHLHTNPAKQRFLSNFDRTHVPGARKLHVSMIKMKIFSITNYSPNNEDLRN